MELIELAFSCFKRFKDERFQLKPGLNLIWGPNESGKSTIHEGITCALFGRERGKTIENWDGGCCAVSLTYNSDDKVYRIERQITEGKTRFGMVAGDDLIDIYNGKDEIAAEIASHLGISSRAVLENTISIKQADISRPGSSDMSAVGDEIQRILTGTSQVSATEAVKKLESGRDAVKGKARPSNPREYDRISQRLTALAEELAKARGSRDRIAGLSDELTGLDSRLERDSARFEVLKNLLERHKRWVDQKKREDELSQRHKESYATVKNIKDTLYDLEKIQSELEGYAPLVGKDDEIADHLNQIDNRRTELEIRLAEIESSSDDTKSVTSRLASILLITGTLITGLAGLAAGFIWDPRMFLLLLPSAVLAVKYMQIRTANRISEFRHITELIESARAELAQLDSEQKSILNYLVSPDTDKAWMKIKTYRSLVAKSNEYEITFRAFLNGRKLSDWEVQESNLAREVSAIRRELDDDYTGYAPSTEESESWRSEHASLQSSLQIAQSRKHEVAGALDAERRNTRDMASLEGEIEYLHMRKNELESLHKAYDEAINALNSVTKTVTEEYLPVLSEHASEYIARTTSGRYSGIQVKSGWDVQVNSIDKSSISPQALSMGTMDQLYLSLRLACGELLSSGKKLPIILDDPFASFDHERLNNALDMLVTLASDNQILLLTHDPYTLEWAKSLQDSCNIHILQGPQIVQ
ncbi:MAG: ATP-binding protein [Armatimonadota bacterium]